MQIGEIGQLNGPFSPNQNVLSSGDNMIIGISIPEDKLMPYDEADKNLGFYFTLNGIDIKIGERGVYEMDTPLHITSLIFPKGAPKGTIIEYRVYDS